MRNSFGAIPVAVVVLGAASSLIKADAAQTVLVDNGQARCVIYVTERVMNPDLNTDGQPDTPRQAEENRRRLRESVRDLALYFEKMSGAPIECRIGPPETTPTGIPILIGELAAERFGAPALSFPYQQGFRIVVTENEVGLVGESDLAVSYAIYELLDQLGCRWYMPSELGEVVPETKTIALEQGDTSLAPFTIYRGIWHADPDYARRNRAGGLPIAAGHALEGYLTKEQLEQHPDWNAEIGGKRSLHPCDVGHRLCWANPEVAAAVADGIVARLDKDPVPSISISPGDGTDFCECGKCRGLDTGDWDASMNCVSITDRYLHFANLIAERVASQYPDIKLGFLAYVQFTRPPLREQVHPNLYPQLAPISYSRAHPMTDDNVPGNKDLRYIVEGWGKAKPAVSCYLYSWFLAESCAPNPMITKWKTDVPILFRNNCLFWQPEGIANFETSMHGIYMGLRLAWNPHTDPQEIVDEVNTRFYCHASRQMSAYWNAVDEIWVNTPEYSGCAWGYLVRFTPDRLLQLRKYMDEAGAACENDSERKRVQIANDSLSLFELFMKMRYDLAEGRFNTLPTDATSYTDRALALAELYAPQKSFGKMYWTPSLNINYFKAFHSATYTDAARIADSNRFVLLTPKPIRQFRYQPDKEQQGEQLGWMQVGFDDSSWSGTDPCVQTWSSLGLHDYMGAMWYRASVELSGVSQGKKAYLWLAATDGSAKLFFNGRHILYSTESRDAEGKTTTIQTDAFTGYAQPASFDITDAVKPGDNRIALVCVRDFQNELGTGGLLGPVVLYREK